MATLTVTSPSAHPESRSASRPASRFDWNISKRQPTTSRKEWTVVRRLMLPFCADPSGSSNPPRSCHQEVM